MASKSEAHRDKMQRKADRRASWHRELNDPARVKGLLSFYGTRYLPHQGKREIARRAAITLAGGQS